MSDFYVSINIHYLFFVIFLFHVIVVLIVKTRFMILFSKEYNPIIFLQYSISNERNKELAKRTINIRKGYLKE